MLLKRTSDLRLQIVKIDLDAQRILAKCQYQNHVRKDVPHHWC
jgi:hypothetical protein